MNGNDWKHLKYGYREKTEHANWTDKIRNEVVLEMLGEGWTMLNLKRKRKRNWQDHRLRRNSS